MKIPDTNEGPGRYFPQEATRDLHVIDECRGWLSELDRQQAEAVLQYLLRWNKDRKARAD